MADGNEERVSGSTEGAGTKDEGADAPDERASDPTAVFELLADETRLAIVRELAAERSDGWQWSGKSFAKLRRAVGARDAGNFSYHLEQLRGPLVVKDDGEYYLRNRGMELFGAVESRRYTDPGEAIRAETEYHCPYPDCDRRVVATYDDQYFRLRCPDHHVFTGTALPPVATDEHTVSELVAVTMLDLRQQVQRARAGVCPLCWGRVDATLPVADPSVPGAGDAAVPDGAVMARLGCTQCGLSFDLPAGACVVDHPAVVAYYHERGEDIRTRPYLALPFTHAAQSDLVSTDPVRVRVDVPTTDPDLRLWLDGETNVVAYERD